MRWHPRGVTDTGLTIPEWSGRRAQLALARVRAEGRAKNEPCGICRERINYDLVKPHPMAVTVQHVKSRARFPELTWDPGNWVPAHYRCNVGDRTEDDAVRAAASMEIGVTSQPW
jgi:5-methylcytosine-specific restriction endonuclease McrA